MDQTNNIFAIFQSLSYLTILDFLLKWAIPIFVIFFLKFVIENFAYYTYVRFDRYLALDKWVTVRGFKGQIIKFSPFGVVLRNEIGDGYKIPIKDFNHIILHQEHCSSDDKVIKKNKDK